MYLCKRYNESGAISGAADKKHTSEELIHNAFEVFVGETATVEYVILGDTVHSAGDEVDEIDALLAGNILHEVIAGHESLVLHIIETVHHIILDEHSEDMLSVSDILAVAVTECAEAGGAAVAFRNRRSIAERVLELIDNDIFLTAEEGVEGLAGYLSFLAHFADTNIREGFGFHKFQQGFGDKTLRKEGRSVIAIIH